MTYSDREVVEKYVCVCAAGEEVEEASLRHWKDVYSRTNIYNNQLDDGNQIAFEMWTSVC